MEFNPLVLKIADYPTSELARRKQAVAAQGKKLFDFSVGDPIEPTAPFIRQALADNVPVVSQYPTVKGIPELNKAIADYIERRFGVVVDSATQVLQCTGSKEAVYNSTFLFVDPGSKKNIVIGPAPGYFVMERSAIVAGGEYYPYNLNGNNNYLLELSEVPEEILSRTAIAWLNYPHNPTGAECDLAFLERQVETARKYDIFLCSDECYVDLYFAEALPPSILEVTTEGVLAFHSCSKRSGMTGYRSGFVAGDKEAISLFAKFRSSLGVAAPEYTQHAALASWKDDKHVEDRRRIFKRKREKFLAFFKKHNLEFIRTDSTFYFWVKSPKGQTGKDYALKLLELGIVVSPGEIFGGNDVNYFRLALVPSEIDCDAAIALWDTIL